MLTSEPVRPHRIRERADVSVGPRELRAHVARTGGYVEGAIPGRIADGGRLNRSGFGKQHEHCPRAVTYLDADPAHASRVGLEVELGSARRLGDERPALTERREDRVDGPTVADLDPRRRSPERIGVASAEIAPVQIMRVAAAESDAPIATTQEALPERERSGVELSPRSVPDLDRMRPRHALVFPRRPEWFRVADADDGSALRGGADGSLHGLRFGLTEFPPAIGAPRVPVPAVGGDLDAGKDDGKAVAAWPVGELMPDAVVVGHAEEVQASLGRGAQHLGRPRIAVRIERVAMEIAA